MLFFLIPVAYLLVAAPLAVGRGRLLKQASDALPVADPTAREVNRERARRRES